MRLLALVLFGALAASPLRAQEKISSLGRYQGYSVATYDGWQRESRYLTMRDGVRLAIDIIRPTRAGVPNQEPLPVVFAHERPA